MKKVYLPIASSTSLLGLLAQAAPALAEVPQPVAVSSQPAAEVAVRPSTPVPEVINPIAAPEPMRVAQAIPSSTAPAAQATLEQINRVSQLSSGDSMPQVTSVSQLSDVKPTDWAFQALQSLVERYGVIAGYPDGTYRGNRAMTRYEFAAGLNAALDRVNELIAAGLADKVSRADLEILRQLQEQFAVELATLRGRVDSLEARSAELEANQFSTTTKLSGEVIFGANGGLSTSQADPNTTFFARARLNFDTSFTGADLLRTRLQGRTNANGPDDAAEFFGAAFSELDYSGGANSTNITLAKLFYAFPVNNDVQVTIGAVGMSLTDFIDANSYANNSSVDFSTFAFGNNQVLVAGDIGDAAAAVAWNPGKGPFTVTAAYTAAEAAEATPTGGGSFPNLGNDDRGGLFGDPYLGGLELAFAPNDSFAIRAQYVGGAVGGDRHNAAGVNFEFKPFKGIALFGRYAYAFDFSAPAAAAAGIGAVAGDNFDNNDEVQSWQLGLAFPNLFVQGALGGISIGQPFIAESVGDVTQFNVEAFYNFPLSDKISITPVLQVINNPDNDSSQGTVYTGTVRTVFKF